MRVVIVDDHPVVRAGLRAVLESSLMVEVIEDFSRPEDAVDWIRAHDVDLVLMDLRFGRQSAGSGNTRIDGTQAIRTIRELDGPPVLVVTSYGSEPEILRALAAGAVGYVLKDSSTQELLSAISAGVQGERFLGTGVRGRVQKREETSTLALTERELDVLRLVAEGHTNEQIADRLFVSKATVKTHLHRSYDKLAVSSRTAAVAAARALGVLEE